MIVVHTRTSASPSANVSITFSSAPSPICPWPDDDPRPGQQPPQLLGLGLDRLDPVVDVEHLAAAVELAQDRVAHEAGRRLRDPGLDRQPVLGRRLDDAQVPDPGQREVERARDRRRADSVSTSTARPQLLEPLLRRDAEPLLLVDDDEPEVLERDVLATAAGGCRSRCRPSRPRAPRPSPPAPSPTRTATAAGPSIGNAANRWLNVVKCCPANTVVGTSTATCLPSWVALNAARSATSVLP